jgi:hypothetical protein
MAHYLEVFPAFIGSSVAVVMPAMGLQLDQLLL